MRRLALVPLLALGPVTGPLAMGVAHYVRAGRWGMAAVCALGIAEVWTLAPMLLAHEFALLRCLTTP